MRCCLLSCQYTNDTYTVSQAHQSLSVNQNEYMHSSPEPDINAHGGVGVHQRHTSQTDTYWQYKSCFMLLKNLRVPGWVNKVGVTPVLCLWVHKDVRQSHLCEEQLCHAEARTDVACCTKGLCACVSQPLSSCAECLCSEHDSWTDLEGEIPCGWCLWSLKRPPTSAFWWPSRNGRHGSPASNQDADCCFWVGL